MDGKSALYRVYPGAAPGQAQERLAVARAKERLALGSDLAAAQRRDPGRPESAVTLLALGLQTGAELQQRRQIGHGGHVSESAHVHEAARVEPVAEQEEAARVLPVIAAIHAALPDVPLSVDTWRPQVARLALQAGATVLNGTTRHRPE